MIRHSISSSRLLGVVALGVLLAPVAAWSFQPAAETGLEVHLDALEQNRMLPHTISEATASQVAAATADLEGSWKVQWNRLTGTPHRVFGSGLQLASGVDSAEELESVARAFVAARPDLLGASPEDLVRIHGAEVGRFRSVLLQQTHHGIPVEGARVDFLYADDRLVMFGSDAHREIDIDTTPALSATAAVAAGAAGMPEALVAPDGAPELRILSIPTELPTSDVIEVVHRLAYRMILETKEPLGRWVTWVDAQQGRLLWRYNDVHYLEVTGNVSADVQDFGYCDGVGNQPLGGLTVEVLGVGSDNTDAQGNYTVTVPDNASRTVTAELRGAHVDVDRQNGADATFSDTATPGTPLDIVWTDLNSQQDERDVYFHTDRVYNFMRALDPVTPFGLLDGALTANVSLASTCNAFWNGSSINFFHEGDGCANTGEIGDVVYHEWGHGLTDFVYAPFSPPSDMHEGNSDIIATHVTESPIIGSGFNVGQCGVGIRTCDNELRYPEDVIGVEGHAAGSVICGFDWDVRKGLETLNPAIFESHSDSLWHFVRVLALPLNQVDQVTTYFFLDDDDGNIANGTPHYFGALCEAADDHGFVPPGPVSNFAISVQHTPLHSTTDDANPYAVSALITSSFGAIDPAQTRLIYRVNGGPEQTAPMSATGIPNEFEGEIPAQPVGTRASYAIVTGDDTGRLGAYPPNRCDQGVPGGEEVFHVATILDELEVDSGWIVGAPDDNATTGVWERIDPVGTAAQPEDDRTPAPGTMAFITGQQPPGGDLGTNDVDGGKTTLFSPVFDLSAYETAEVLYHRWYSNNTGATPNTDFWVVDVSNDGGATWINVENTDVTDHSWKEIRVDLISLFGAPPNLVQFRFIASDEGAGSLVEAGVDEFMIFAGIVPTAVAESSGSAPVRFALGEAVPNPFNPSTTVSFELPVAAPVTLAVYDVHGRLVRELIDGRTLEVGAHEVRWDGREDGGAPAASGVYYVRMAAPGFSATKKLVMLK